MIVQLLLGACKLGASHTFMGRTVAADPGLPRAHKFGCLRVDRALSRRHFLVLQRPRNLEQCRLAAFKGVFSTRTCIGTDSECFAPCSRDVSRVQGSRQLLAEVFRKLHVHGSQRSALIQRLTM